MEEGKHGEEKRGEGRGETREAWRGEEWRALDVKENYREIYFLKAS